MLDIAFLDRLFAALPPAIRDSRPACALVLGSGWNRALDDLRVLAECSYESLPGLGKAAVPGHDGRIVLFELPAADRSPAAGCSATTDRSPASGCSATPPSECAAADRSPAEGCSATPPSECAAADRSPAAGCSATPPSECSAAPRLGLAFCGRRHWYECEKWEPAVFPADFCRRLGIPRLLLTNAAGGINPAYRPGDIVLVRDHLRLNYLNPLLGPHNPLFGPRFPDQSHVYGEAFRADLHAAADAAGVPLAEGVYAFSCGPTFETPAEVRAYGILGADLVGMSTVPEAIVASACGIDVAALSLVTNMAAGLGSAALTHEEVVETARTSTARMVRLLSGFLRR